MGRLGQKSRKIASLGMKVGAGVVGLGVAGAGAFGLGLKSTGDGDLGRGAPLLGEFNKRVPAPQAPAPNLFSGLGTSTGQSLQQEAFVRGAEAEFDDFDTAFSTFKKGGRVRRKKYRY